MAEPGVALGLSLLAADDVRGAVLQEVHAADLCQLKAVSAAWCAHARRELCTRLCRYNENAITDLDVECLNDAGRPWEVAIAGRQLPQLARLRGFGFVVDVQAVRQVDLGVEDDDDDDEDDDDRVNPNPNPNPNSNPNSNPNPNPNPNRMTMPALAGRPCAAACTRARVSHLTRCCSQPWPARRLRPCAGFLCSGCGRTMPSAA